MPEIRIQITPAQPGKAPDAGSEREQVDEETQVKNNTGQPAGPGPEEVGASSQGGQFMGIGRGNFASAVAFLQQAGFFQKADAVAECFGGIMAVGGRQDPVQKHRRGGRGGPQPVVVVKRAVEGFIKIADPFEHAAAPEAGRLADGAAFQQRVHRPGADVIGGEEAPAGIEKIRPPENKAGFWMGGESIGHCGHGAGAEQVVGIDAAEEGAGGFAEAGVQSGGLSAIRAAFPAHGKRGAGGEAAQDVHGAIGGAPVLDDEFKGSRELGGEAVEGSGQEGGLLVAGHDDGELGGAGRHAQSVGPGAEAGNAGCLGGFENAEFEMRNSKF